MPVVLEAAVAAAAAGCVEMVNGSISVVGWLGTVVVAVVCMAVVGQSVVGDSLIVEPSRLVDGSG